MADQKSVGEGVVSYVGKFLKIHPIGVMPFQSGEPVYILGKDGLETLEHEKALLEHTSSRPPIEMGRDLERLFPSVLQPKEGKVVVPYFRRDKIFRPDQHHLVVEYISIEEGIRLLMNRR